jgi:acetyl-CoA C-acetyltransferase
MDPAAISRESGNNRMIADPYTKSLVARDQVNLGAAVLIASTKTADALGVPASKRAYIKGFSYTKDISLVERIDLGRSYAMNVSYAAALEAAGVRAESIRYFDLYSCFPISVFAAIDAMGLEPADPRRFTVTGGLPYFGGPGNNYALHAIASMVDLVRQHSDALGLVGAVGGLLSSHAVGVYSAKPSPLIAVHAESLQQRVLAQPRLRFDWAPTGAANIETYTVLYNKGIPADAIIFGRLERDGSRILATLGADHAMAARMAAEDVLGRRVFTATKDGLSRFTFDPVSERCSRSGR